MFILSFYVPIEYAEKVKNAMFDAGGGQIGAYDRCAWQTLGQGQFRPLSESNPFLGTKGELETLPELKVEMVCDEKHLQAVLAALKASHPYETPAFHVLKSAF